MIKDSEGLRYLRYLDRNNIHYKIQKVILTLTDQSGTILKKGREIVTDLDSRIRAWQYERLLNTFRTIKAAHEKEHKCKIVDWDWKIKKN